MFSWLFKKLVGAHAEAVFISWHFFPWLGFRVQFYNPKLGMLQYGEGLPNTHLSIAQGGSFHKVCFAHKFFSIHRACSHMFSLQSLALSLSLSSGEIYALLDHTESATWTRKRNKKLLMTIKLHTYVNVILHAILYVCTIMYRRILVNNDNISCPRSLSIHCG